MTLLPKCPAKIARFILSEGEAVTYTRGEDMITGLIALARQPEFLVEVDDTVRVAHQDMDWSVVAADLVIDGDAITPQANDTITRADGTVYQILPRDRDACWRWGDPAKTLLRIHSKQVSS